MLGIYIIIWSYRIELYYVHVAIIAMHAAAIQITTVTYYYFNGLSLCRFQSTYLLFGFPIHYFYWCTLRSFLTALQVPFQLERYVVTS